MRRIDQVVVMVVVLAGVSLGGLATFFARALGWYSFGAPIVVAGCGLWMLLVAKKSQHTEGARTGFGTKGMPRSSVKLYYWGYIAMSIGVLLSVLMAANLG